MEITVDHTKSAVITAQLAQEQCKVLIDTGAARCCIREDYYHKLSNAPRTVEKCKNKISNRKRFTNLRENSMSY